MHVMLWPFYSSQDKQRRQFLLASDSGVKFHRYLAERLLADGHNVTVIQPPKMYRAQDGFRWPEGCLTYKIDMPLDNRVRRLHWPVGEELAECDVLFTTHVFLAYPARMLNPKLHIIMECGVAPETAYPEMAELFPLAWRAADLVHCSNEALAKRVREAGGNAVVWPFGYDERIAEAAPMLTRDVDVLFNARCSNTGYSNHELFRDATAGMERVVMTDRTNLLGASPQFSDSDYRVLLHTSKTVVGLMASGFCGYAFMEAVACGCCPIALRTPEYEELLTPAWPYYCEANADSVRDAIRRALTLGWWGVPTQLEMELQNRLAKCTYQNVWERCRAYLSDRRA
jgi:hypothetical protein